MGSGKRRRFLRLHEWHRPAHYTGDALACRHCGAHAFPQTLWMVDHEACKRRMVNGGDDG